MRASRTWPDLCIAESQTRQVFVRQQLGLIMNRYNTSAFLILALISIFVLQACEPPSSNFRRSAMRTGLFGAQGAVPAAEGHVAVSGAISHAGVNTVTPEINDPALHVAETNLSGEFQYGVSRHLAMGLHAQGSRYGWTRPSADGTPPLIGSELAIGYGVNLGLHTGERRGLYASTGLRLTAMEAPWSAFELESGEAERCPPCEGEPPHYRSVDSGVENVLLYNISTAGGWFLNENLGWLAGFSLQNSLTNIGFSDEPHDGSTIEGNLQFVPYVAMHAAFDSGPFLQLQLFAPWDDEVHGLSPGVMAQIGVEL